MMLTNELYNVNMQKGSVLPLVLVLSLVVAGAFFYLNGQQIKAPLPSPSQDFLNISKNRSYQNTKLGFEFEYPSNIEVVEDSEEKFNERGHGNFRKNFTYYVTYQPAEVLGIVVSLDESKSYDKAPLTLWVFDNSDNLTIEKWYNNFWYYPFVWGDYTLRRNEVAPINEATISGQMAKSGIVDYQPGTPKFVYLSNNGKMYLFRIIGEEGDKIFESFKFIN